MPIYEYECRKCGNHFDVLIRNEDDYPDKCTSCSSKNIIKAFSAFAVSSSSAAGDCPECPAAGSCGASSPCASGGCPF